MSSNDPSNEDSTIDEKTRVLSHIDDNPSFYKEVKKSGPVSMDVLSSENKLFIVRMPKGLVDPLSLINTKVTVGGGRVSQMSVNEKNLEAVTFTISSDAPGPTLFLPNLKGELHQADGALIGQVQLRDGIQNGKEQSIIDIDSLRSIVHKPPEDIKERHFFERSEESLSPRKKKKKSKKNVDSDSIPFSPSSLKDKINENEMMQTNSPDTPKIKKKKKKIEDESPKSGRSYDSSFAESPNISNSSKKKKKKKMDQE
ncbi:unnamed protein product [Meganyctiphanes norvegica]|uniref:DNA-directed RNA polymerase I subunit RPA34 n=1 Tax=Meganyctiphanes norvegica TaxID=48144 RepID=A0AAV2SGC1_MEGNR